MYKKKPRRRLSLFFPCKTGVICNGKRHAIFLMPDGRLSLPEHPQVRKRMEEAKILAHFGGTPPKCLQILEAWNCLFSPGKKATLNKGDLFYLLPQELKQKRDLLAGMKAAGFKGPNKTIYRNSQLPVLARVETKEEKILKFYKKLRPTILGMLSSFCPITEVILATPNSHHVPRVAYTSTLYINFSWIVKVFCANRLFLDNCLVLSIAAELPEATVFRVYDFISKREKILLKTPTRTQEVIL